MPQPKKTRSPLALAGFGAAVLAAGLYAARYSPKHAGTRLWYARLKKPGYTPPSYVFPIVWTILYSLIAVSGWRVWTAQPSWRRRKALRLWAEQLMANAEWSRLFFGEHRPQVALLDLVAMEGLILEYISVARKVDRAAALLFVPYMAWVAFAALLNADIALLNLDARHKFPKPRVV
ncbi:MAG TPA: TspO/MBR family protein [Terriglobales bacterium]|nr:TspO/MBR family protein [Terriglobales bacterium]